MSASSLVLAGAIVRFWVGLYTSGLARGVRDGRRAEIASDLWEHQHDGLLLGRSARDVALEILGRWLRGVPADLTWRLQLKGDPKMFEKIALERTTGGLMLLFVVVMMGSMFAGGPGIGAEQPYFADDFKQLAFGQDRFQNFPTVLGLQLIMSVVLILAAAGMYLTFRPHGAVLATGGAFLLVASGVLWLVDAAAARSVHSLALEWRAAGANPGDAIATAARSVALIYEFLGFGSAFLMLTSFACFGSIVAWRAAMPRWLGGVAIVSGGLLLVSLASWPLIGDMSWLIMMSSFLFAVIWTIVTAGWLVIRGTAEAPSPGPA